MDNTELPSTCTCKDVQIVLVRFRCNRWCVRKPTPQTNLRRERLAATPRRRPLRGAATSRGGRPNIPISRRRHDLSNTQHEHRRRRRRRRPDAVTVRWYDENELYGTEPGMPESPALGRRRAAVAALRCDASSELNSYIQMSFVSDRARVRNAGSRWAQKHRRLTARCIREVLGSRLRGPVGH
ncbi:hypothetical protein EVAR_39782_1 [Eumeta japonica]|uniref:Uncharacterized protein n=1 Tax=Eumeta variegata TaxID=151549 RepID=A0A4C1X2W0_EUMVA|nr:hypothetical protein EVAR_39782_1 [Eumeta japonica]